MSLAVTIETAVHHLSQGHTVRSLSRISAHWSGNWNIMMKRCVWHNATLSYGKNQLMGITENLRITQQSLIKQCHDRFKVLTAVLLKIWVFWGVMLCSWVCGSQHFETAQCPHLQGQAVHENESTVILWNIRNCITNKQHHIPEYLYLKQYQLLSSQHPPLPSTCYLFLARMFSHSSG
jgi:hypothetical protein